MSVRAGVPCAIANLRFDIEGTPRIPKSSLSRDELPKLIEAAKEESPDVRAMLIVGIVTGMRFCELSALEWPDIDLAAGMINLNRSQIRGHAGPPKTEASRRAIYLPREVVRVLLEHRAWQLERQQEDGIPDGAIPGARLSVEPRPVSFPEHADEAARSLLRESGDQETSDLAFDAKDGVEFDSSGSR